MSAIQTPSSTVVGRRLGLLLGLAATSWALGADGTGSVFLLVGPIIGIALLGAGLALRRLVDRPRPAGVPVEGDDRARRETAAAVVAACAVLVAGPLVATSAALGKSMVDGCSAPEAGAGLVLFWVAGTAVPVVGWALVVLLRPRREPR